MTLYPFHLHRLEEGKVGGDRGTQSARIACILKKSRHILKVVDLDPNLERLLLAGKQKYHKPKESARVKLSVSSNV